MTKRAIGNAKRIAYFKNNRWYPRTRAEEDLRFRALQFEARYFKDMTFSLHKYGRLFRYQMEGCDGWMLSSTLQQIGISIEYWRFALKKLRTCDGRCNAKKYLIEIDHKHNDMRTLLHEMIHAYEVMLNDSYVSSVLQLHNYIMLDLYERLRGKIGRRRLWQIINTDTHEYLQEGVWHSRLFLLKSLDLDIRLKKKLGFIYCYERDNRL